VNDRFELFACLGTREYDPTERAAVDTSVARENGASEAIDDAAFTVAP
jgi:hypothetical protein